MPSVSRSGRCACGSVRYELAGALGPLVNCHCRYCRRAHGAAFATVSLVRSAGFRLTAGAEHLREHRNPEGARCFCALCGTRLFKRLASTDAFLSLVVASLDQEPGEGPVAHINVESKAGWYEILDDLPQHAALPPGIGLVRGE
jgi:hypothetical protein